MRPLYVLTGTTEQMWELGFVLSSAEFSQPGHTLRWHMDVEGGQFTFCPLPACRGSKGQLLLHRRAGKAAGPQYWFCGSLNIAILHLPPDGLCSELGDLLFINHSACDKGLCFKVFSLFKGIYFNFKYVHLLYQGTGDTLAVSCCWRRTWVSDGEGSGCCAANLPPRRKPRQGFHVARRSFHYSRFITFYLTLGYPAPDLHKVFSSPSSQKWEKWLNPTPFNVQEKAIFSHCWGKSAVDSLKSPSCGFLASVKREERVLWTGNSLNGQHKVQEGRGCLQGRRRGRLLGWPLQVLEDSSPFLSTSDGG